MTSTSTFVECDRRWSPQILAILNDAIEHSTALYDYRPRAPETMAAWFDAKERGRFPVVGVAGPDGTLRGFGTYGTFRAWPAYRYSVEHSLYVHRDHRRQGIGRMLLDALVTRARAQEYHTLIAGIDADNAASIALHQACGFLHCGTIRHAGFKFGRWLDLAFYQRLLDTPASPADG